MRLATPTTQPATHQTTTTAAQLTPLDRASRGARIQPSDRANRGARIQPSGRASRGARIQPSDRGAVTAELAITLPVLLSLLLLGIWSIGMVVLNIQCIDAARDVARAVARGEPPDEAKAIGHRTIPTGEITITREGSDIHVTVTAAPSHKPPLLSALAPSHLTAHATLQSEPTTQDETP
jgi:hypothetical protein